MRRLFLLPLFFLMAQEATVAQGILSDLENGLVFSTRATTGTEFNTDEMGFEIAAGYYWLKNLSPRFRLSLDARLSYAQAEGRQQGWTYTEDPLRLPLDTSLYGETGRMDHLSVAAVLPVKLRYQPSEKVPVFIMVAYEARFHIHHTTDWDYDEVRYQLTTNTSTLVEPGLERSLQQRFFSGGATLGLGFQANQWMIEATVGGYLLRFDDNYVNGVSSNFFGLNMYYRLE